MTYKKKIYIASLSPEASDKEIEEVIQQLKVFGITSWRSSGEITVRSIKRYLPKKACIALIAEEITGLPNEFCLTYSLSTYVSEAYTEAAHRLGKSSFPEDSLYVEIWEDITKKFPLDKDGHYKPTE